MNAKRLAASPRETWQAMRARYTWHLRPPFNKAFDHSHWCKGKPEPEPAAALYELARRHPLAGNQHRESPGQPGSAPSVDSEALDLLAMDGLKAWPQLTPDTQEMWVDSAGNMKGVDCRDPNEQCYPICLLAPSRLQVRRLCEIAKRPEVKGMTSAELYQFAAQDLIKHPLPVEEVEAAVARMAVEAYRKGHCLLAVALDLPADKAAALMAENYRHLPRLNRNRKQRARSENWLALIAEFEDAETTIAGGVKSQSFVRYRRAMDGLRFPPKQAELIGGIRCG
jgi:hypothetical protein